jgi:putative endonuclease
MARKHERGRQGEQLAAEHLTGLGWAILARNWRDGPRELDLVAFRDGVLAFVEVKARVGRDCGNPLEGITWRKRREVERAAAAWLRRHGEELPPVQAVRFDAVAVRLSRNRHDGPPHLTHLEDAWWKGD